MSAVYMRKKPPTPSAVLTLRVPADLDRRLARQARRRRRTRSQIARAILESALQNAETDDTAVEARRQSLLASERPSEREAFEFIAATADLKGWR
jgi:predicted transcriptional regulator